MVEESIARKEFIDGCVFENSCRHRLLQHSALLTSFTAFQVSSLFIVFFFVFVFNLGRNYFLSPNTMHVFKI